ncbi:MAG: ribonuclease D [Holosporales bacterium]|jgi:ribonuclease D|nr:ribonuclease D [Holosporales bacterium]
MRTYLHTYDIPDDVLFGNLIAVDTETTGLCLHRDRLCLVQFNCGDGAVHLVHFPDAVYDKSQNICNFLISEHVQKIFHYARFDIAFLAVTFGVFAKNVYCTKIASKIARTFSDQHSLKALCRDLLNIDISKTEQRSYWGAATLTPGQLDYASTDVLYLHNLKNMLDVILVKENRMALAQGCFDFLPLRARLDVLGGWHDIFEH